MSSTDEKRLQEINETIESIKRIQNFDPKELVRTEELGRDLNFENVLEPALKIINLFKQVSLDVIPEFSQQRLTKTKTIANAIYNNFQQILNFSVATDNPKNTRDGLIMQIKNEYDKVFENLFEVIAYSVRQSTDFARLEREARASIQAINDRTDELQNSIQKSHDEANEALEGIRQIAAEQGVSQQAIHFKEESENYSKSAKNWLVCTSILTIVIVLFAFLSLFIHKIEFIEPTNTYEAAQLIVSKLLIFSTLIFFLVLSARNYTANRHNAIINKHRQNSLVVYKAIVEASHEQTNRDIVLTKAADSIFSQESTGFIKGSQADGSALSMVNLSPSLLKPSNFE